MSRFGSWKVVDAPALDAIRGRGGSFPECAPPLFGEHGYDAIDVQGEADAAGVGRATVYRQFESSERLFLATLDREMDLLAHRVRRDAESVGVPFEGPSKGVRSSFLFLTERPWAAELLIIEEEGSGTAGGRRTRPTGTLCDRTGSRAVRSRWMRG